MGKPALQLRGKERAIVKAMEAFANLPPKPSRWQVERVLRQVYRLSYGPGTLTTGRAGRATAKKDEYPFIAELQPKLRTWLEKIISDRKSSAERRQARISVALEVQRQLRSLPGRFVHTEEGLEFNYRVTSVKDGCLIGVALVLTVPTLVDRLGQCRYCGRFNVDLGVHRGPAQFFCPGHKELYDQSPTYNNLRQTRHRITKQENKLKQLKRTNAPADKISRCEELLKRLHVKVKQLEMQLRKETK